MKKNYFFAGMLIVSIGFFAFQNTTEMEEVHLANFKMHKQLNGGQAGLTGAPGEDNCTQCHVGSVLDGSSEIVFVALNSSFVTVTSYNPGQVYTISVDLSSDPTRKGFSATALDGSNNMAGSFTGSSIGGTQDFSSGGRDYVSHTGSSNTDQTQTWAWTWTAPATNVGDVTFYIAANVANDNGAVTGDMIYLTERVLGSVASVDEQEQATASFTAGYSPEGNKVVMDFTSLTSGDMFFNLVDMNGKSVYSKTLSKSLIGTNKQIVALPDYVKNGMYAATLFIGNKPMSANILVQK